MQPLYLTIDDPQHAQNRIKEVFGFDSKVLLGVIEDGFAARNETTNNHPKIYGVIDILLKEPLFKRTPST